MSSVGNLRLCAILSIYIIFKYDHFWTVRRKTLYNRFISVGTQQIEADFGTERTKSWSTICLLSLQPTVIDTRAWRETYHCSLDWHSHCNLYTISKLYGMEQISFTVTIKAAAEKHQISSIELHNRPSCIVLLLLL